MSHVTHERAFVWARAPQATRIHVEYGTSPTLTGAARTTTRFATTAGGLSVSFELAPLQASTRYHYAFHFEDPANPGVYRRGNIGSFRTPPPPNVSVPVRFGFGGDIRNLSEYGIFDALRLRNLDFFVCLGDFPYADAGPAAFTTAEYRSKHLEARDSSSFQSFTRTTPFVATWDDHEVVNNWDGATDPVRVATGVDVWREMFPLPPGPEIYRTLRWGNELELFILDCRKHRSANSDPDLAGSKTMLGAVQLAWLKQALSASTARVKVIATSVPLRYTTGLDHWNGFMRERAELLEHIRREGLTGVTFISADQHRPANNHYREGFKEFVSGPLAIGPSRPPLRVDPEMRWSRAERSYSIFTIDPASTPQRVIVEHVSPTVRQWVEVFEIEEPARVRVTSDEPEGSFRLLGPHYFRGSGTDTTFARVEPGTYRLQIPADARFEERPADLTIDVDPGAEVNVALQRVDVPSATNPVLHHEAFERPLVGATIVDLGTTSGPSAWFTDHGLLYQSSNVHTPGQEPAFPGTMAIFGATTWRDVTLSCRMRSEDDDGMGLVFRVNNAQNFYRFQWDAQRGLRRLTRTFAGSTIVLAEDSVPYDRLRWYEVDVTCIGPDLTVHVDGEPVLSATDSAIRSGAVGCWTWANSLTAFDQLIVREGNALGPSPNVFLHDRFEDGSLGSYTIVDEGTTSGPSRWIERGGELVQESNVYSGSTGSATSLPRPGTMALTGSSGWTDYLLRARLMNEDDDGIGIVFRYAGSDDYERFSMDAQQGFRQYSRKVGGSWVAVHTDFLSYTPGRIYDVEVIAEGDRRRITIDGESFFEGSSGGGSLTGRVGFYSFASENAHFDDLLVRPIPGERAVLVSASEPTGWALFGRAPASGGEFLFLALSLARRPGLPASVLDPNDPRTLHLVPDSLFLTSLTPSPLLPGFQQTLPPDGSFRAGITLPPIPALTGLPFHAAGFTFPASGRSLTELLPTVDLRFR